MTSFRGLMFLLLLVTKTALASDLPSGASEFAFTNWQGPAIKIRVFVPEKHSDAAPVVIVMHGASRDAERYFDDWAPLGEQHGHVIVVPEFPVDEFDKSARYNLGHVFEPGTNEVRPQATWTFAAIEPLFDEIVSRLRGRQGGYTIYGHSAGSQFVHRYLYYMPDARVNQYIAANAGWYTLPNYEFGFPYGLTDAELEERELPRILAADMILLLGRDDTDPKAAKLRQTPEARRQGPNRLSRGMTMFRVGKMKAEELGVPFNWQLLLVSDADHDNAKMAPAAAELVE